jgi:hypothetical protein
MPQSADYGSLGPVVTTVGWLMSATAAITFSWRRRAKWEPSEQDVATAPQRVGGLLTAVGIGIVWKRLNDVAYDDLLTRLAIELAIGCSASLVLYTLLISTKTYTQQYSPAPNQTASRRIIGGFCLTDAARIKLREKRSLTVQNLLTGSGNDPDKVWKPFCRAAAKVCFVIGYLGLTVCGSIALTATAILLLPKERIKVVEESSGPKLSGIGDTWSPWYSVNIGSAAKGYTLDKVEFWLTGDRQCSDGADCKEAGRGDSGVTELFRLRGHLESTTALPTEAHLRVTYKPTP